MEDYNNDLAEIRQQLGALKQRIEHETALNEQLLHDALRTKARALHHTVLRIILMGCSGIVLWWLCGYMLKLSLGFIILTTVMLIASVTAEYLINHIDEREMQTDLTATVKRLVRMKRLRLYHSGIGMTFILCIWLPFLIYEIRSHLSAEESQHIVIGTCIGVAIGAIIGLTILYKMQRANNEMIRQIKDYTH